MKPFKFLPHTADIKIVAYGKTINEVFENSALAVSNYLSRGKKIKSSKKEFISIEAPDKDGNVDHKRLLYEFVDNIIYLLDAEKFIVSSAKVKIDSGKLEVEFKGDDTKNYKDLDHIKAATFAEMEIKKIQKGYEAVFVVDI